MQEKSTNSDIEGESLTARFKTWLKANIRGKSDSSLREALEEILEEHEEENEQTPSEEHGMLKKVLNFGELDVKDIMTPRTDIKAVDYNVSLPELKNHLIEYGHTRVPVFNDTLDDIKGFVHIKDLLPTLSGDATFNMALILRDIVFVPPSMKLSNLLLKMRSSGVHIAIVIDEYGGTDGLVTLEDIFEEIVGEIQDEHDEDEGEEFLQWNEQGFCDVDARTGVRKLEQDLHIKLEQDDEDGDYDTLGGLIFYQIEHVPVKGEILEYNSIKFEVLEADPRRIQKVRIYSPQSSVN
ncbi:MAG: hemolysin family protein [Pseudomonadota bacterium]